jgi:hypothetical protein
VIPGTYVFNLSCTLVGMRRMGVAL